MTYASRTRARTERHVGPCQTGTLSVGQLKLFTGSNLFTSALIRQHLIHLVLVHQVRAGILREDVHGGDRRLLRQPVRQRGQLPSARGGKIPVSEFLDLVIKCVNGKCWLVPSVGSVVPVSAKCHFCGIGIPSQALSLYTHSLHLLSLSLSLCYFSAKCTGGIDIFSLYSLTSSFLMLFFIPPKCVSPFLSCYSQYVPIFTQAHKLSVHNICKGMAWVFPVMVCLCHFFCLLELCLTLSNVYPLPHFCL